MSEDLTSSSNIYRVLSNFDCKIKDLKEIYSNDVNCDLKIKLLRVWLEIALIFNSSYGEEGLRVYLKSKTHSFFCVAENIEGNKNNCVTYCEGSKSASFFAIFIIKFLDLIYVRGHPTSVNLRGKLKRLILRKIPILLRPKKNSLRRLKIIDFLNDCCDSDSLDTLFNEKMPAVFFSNQFGKNANKKIKIIGAPSALFDFDGYENLILLNRKIDFIGIQHGGGYNFYVDDFFFRSESELSSTFFGLGTEEINFFPYRYDNIFLPKGHKANIFWIERPKLSLMTKYTMPDMYTFEEGIEGINYIETELDCYKDISFRLPYSNRRSSQYDLVTTNIHKSIKPPERVIDSKSIVIFDQITQTLIYFCIQFNISFIVVLKKEIKNFLTPSGIEFLNLLSERKSIVYLDNPGELVSVIKTKIDEIN